MKRRNFLTGLSAAGAMAQIQTEAPQVRWTYTGPDTRWARSALRKRELTSGVSWPSHEPLQFLLRRGGHSENPANYYELQHDPANIQKMAEAGVRYGRLHFYKGLGLEYEKPEIEKTSRMAALMRERGMKVSLYIGGTMFIESFYREVPDAVEWEQRDQNNRPVPYMQTQTFRHYACPNHPGYRAYMKKVVRVAVEDVKADQIFFDNVQLQPEPKSCRCPRCGKAFHDFLRRRYATREAALRRFGFPDVEWIRVNEWDVYNTPDSVSAVDDPVIQEWIRFRCESMARHYNELYDYAKSLNPKLSVGLNLKGLYGNNRMWLNGIYHSLYSGKCDFMCFDVNGMESRLDEKTGALISEIRSYKLGRSLDISCDDVMHSELHTAAHMAFNYQKETPGYGPHGGPYLWGASATFSPILEFFREYNERYLTRTKNVADVAVLRNWPSMAYSIGHTLAPAILAEQVLIQYRVPFDLLYEEQWDRIGNYRAVILAGQECLSGKQVDALVAYAHDGGTVILAGRIASYNDWRERRRQTALSRPFDVPAVGVHVRQEGKGRIVHFPPILEADRDATATAVADNPEIAASNSEKGHDFPPHRWVLPRNHNELYRAIVDGIAGGLSVTSAAPLTTAMEILNRAETRESILHFVNFDRKKRVEPFRVEVRPQFAAPVKSVVCYSPDADEPAPLPFQESGGRIRFTAPGMRVYSMIVIAHRA